MKKRLTYLIMAILFMGLLNINCVAYQDGSCNDQTKALVVIACNLLVFWGFSASASFNQIRSDRYYWFIAVNKL